MFQVIQFLSPQNEEQHWAEKVVSPYKNELKGFPKWYLSLEYLYPTYKENEDLKKTKYDP